MISRYALPEMEKIFSKESKVSKWLKIELLICEAWNKEGLIDDLAINQINEKASFSIKRIDDIEKVTRHDLAAFVVNVIESIGHAGRYFHFGVTSSDIIDTSLALTLVEAINLIEQKIENLISILSHHAKIHKFTPTIGRTHGIHAEPMTLGLKILRWIYQLQRDKERILQAKEVIRFGKISGAVGTYATVPPAIEEYVCERLGLNYDKVSSQIIQRDRHAQFVSTLAILAGTLETIALELRHLQRTEVSEAYESFNEGQMGSSAMPHKKNPISFEQICGLSRVVRSYNNVALENIALWHERDISHSSAERIILADSSILIDYMLEHLIKLLSGIYFDVEKMKENMEISAGSIFSQNLMLELIKKGYTREDSYKKIQSLSSVSQKEKKSFKKSVLSDEDLKKLFDESELENIFSYTHFLRFTDEIYKRFNDVLR